MWVGGRIVSPRGNAPKPPASIAPLPLKMGKNHFCICRTCRHAIRPARARPHTNNGLRRIFHFSSDGKFHLHDIMKNVIRRMRYELEGVAEGQTVMPILQAEHKGGAEAIRTNTEERTRAEASRRALYISGFNSFIKAIRLFLYEKTYLTRRDV